MIYFKTIRWKNFLSTGNQFIEVDLQKAPSTLIVGANGSGKSTLLDALCFVLFNRPFRDIKKEQLVNTINQNDCDGDLGGDSWFDEQMEACFDAQLKPNRRLLLTLSL